MGRARAKRAPHRYCCWRARSARPLCVWCECWRHVCVLALGSLTLYTWIICLCIAHIYTLHMISVWTIVAEEYDFWVISGWKICILGQYSGWKIWFWRQFAIILTNFGPKIMFPSQIWTHNLYQKWKQLLGHNLHYNMHYDMHIASYACANALRGHNWYIMHAIMAGPQ